MTDREKLIELLSQCSPPNIRAQLGGDKLTVTISQGKIADHLIANGVTFATDNNVGGKWIPVTERLPEKDGQYLCNYHFGNHRDMTFTRVLDYYATDKIPHFQHTLGDTTMKVTHWMPLPQAPKGE